MKDSIYCLTVSNIFSATLCASLDPAFHSIFQPITTTMFNPSAVIFSVLTFYCLISSTLLNRQNGISEATVIPKIANQQPTLETTTDDLENLLEEVVEELIQHATENNTSTDPAIIAEPSDANNTTERRQRPSLTIRIPEPLKPDNQSSWFRKRSVELKKRSYLPIHDTCPTREVQRALEEEGKVYGADRTPTPYPFDEVNSDDKDEL